PLLTKGGCQDGAPRAAVTQIREIVLRTDIRDVQRAMLAHPGILCPINTDLKKSKRYRTKMSTRNHHLPFTKSQHHIINPTNPCSALDDRIEHRLNVCRRAADDAEHLGGRGLVLQSLLQLFGSRTLPLQRFGELLT